VLQACFEALLSLDAEASRGFVLEALEGDALVAECAALAIGLARLDALEALVAWLDRSVLESSRRVACTAIGLLRTPASVDALLEVLGAGGVADARFAIEALAVYARDPEVAARVKGAAGEHSRAAWAAAVEHFPPH